MPFASGLTERSEAAQSHRKPFVSPFLQLSDQKPEAVIRILDKNTTDYWRYWLNVKVGNAWVGHSVIIGRNSPIRDYMNTLDRNDPKRRSPSKRGYVNVLERTLVDAEGRLSDTGTPVNQVKIWDIGVDIAESLQIFDGRQMNRTTMKKMQLQEFDISIVRTVQTASDGSKRNGVVVSPGFDDTPLSEEYLLLPRYDLVKMVQPMPEEAQIRLLNGEDYNEVRKSLGWDGNYPMIDPTESIPF